MTKVVELATSICKTLFDAGYTAYFAGGWVRDLLLHRPSDEIDIATSAPPLVIQQLFPKTIGVGVAFGVLIVVLENHNFEVTTFRKDHLYEDGRHPTAVDFSTPEKDAMRRDFTINGMFYDPLSETIYDYVGGQEDLKKKMVKAIGNPDARFQEDRLRMIRAARFTAQLDFSLDPRTKEAIQKNAPSLFPSVSMERVYQEFHKMHPLDRSIELLYELGLLQVIFPSLKNLSHESLKNVLSPFKYFPKSSPLLPLMEFFSDLSLEKKIELCHYLKGTKKECRQIEFFHHAKNFLQKERKEDWEFAHFYADPLHDLFLQFEAARILPPDRLHYFEEHDVRKKRLKKHIERLEEKNPLLKAKHLMKEGISPGKKMGLLLKEAERIAINEDLHAEKTVMEKVKTLPLWDA